MVAVLLFFALIAALPAEAAGAKSAPLKIVAFGDSLTSGHRLPSKDAYPSVLQGKLKAAGLPVAVVNPRQVRDFGKAVGQLAKTDALDAARCQTRRPRR